MKNKINFTNYIVVSAILLFVALGNMNAADYCKASNKATFDFKVEPAIGITTTNVTLPPLCPGCRRDWLCDQSPYWMQWDITGSLECKYQWNSGDGLIPSPNNLDQNATLVGCWYELVGLVPPVWIPAQNTVNHVFLNNNGQGKAAYRYYINAQTANCNASGTYSWSMTVNVNYVCSLQNDQVETVIGKP